MNSKKAEAYMDSKVEEVDDVVKFGTPKFVIRLHNAIYSVELAEQEAEERVRKRAIEAFCEDCPLYNHAGNCPDCSALNAFKQRLNEE